MSTLSTILTCSRNFGTAAVIHAAINKMVFDTNLAFQASNIDAAVRRVGASAVQLPVKRFFDNTQRPSVARR